MTPTFLSVTANDIPFDHATLTDPRAAAAMQVNTRPVLGNYAETYSYATLTEMS